MIICIEGTIGVGKSTLIKALKQYCEKKGFETIVLDEPICPELLQLYVSDIKRYALSFQLIILRDRVELFKQALRQDSPKKIILLDRGLIGDQAFALMQYENGFFTEEEYNVYKKMNTSSFVINESYRVVYLRCEPKVAFERMKKRGQEQYTLEYLTKLHEVHDELLEGYTTFDWNSDRESISDELCKSVLYSN